MAEVAAQEESAEPAPERDRTACGDRAAATDGCRPPRAATVWWASEQPGVGCRVTGESNDGRGAAMHPPQLTITRRLRRVATMTVAVVATLAAPAAEARTIAINADAKLHRTSKSNGVTYFSGTATGSLPGRVNAGLRIGIFAVPGTVTLYPRGGTITLAVDGDPKSLTYVTGTVKVTGGTGKFAGARGRGDFAGTLYRYTKRPWRADVSIRRGTLTY